MSGPEHLDPESTDPLFGSVRERRDFEEWEPWNDGDWLSQDGDPADYGLRPAPGLLDGFAEQRPADFDDEETRP